MTYTIFDKIHSWVHSYVALARLNKPSGILLLYFPCLWAHLLASHGSPKLYYILLFFVGAVLMRSAGCTYNDLVDMPLDAQVKRTQTRPVASGEISRPAGILFLIVQLTLGAWVLFQLPPLSVALGLVALVLTLAYPWMKRITYWPQVFLGLTFGWAVLLSWSATTNNLSSDVWLLYGGVVFWVTGYDTIYGHQDKEDDLIIGVKSTALRFSHSPRTFLGAMYALSIFFWFALGVAKKMSVVYFLGLLTAMIQMLWQVAMLEFDNPEDCFRKFRSNIWIGVLITVSIALSKVPAPQIWLIPN